MLHIGWNILKQVDIQKIRLDAATTKSVGLHAYLISHQKILQDNNLLSFLHTKTGNEKRAKVILQQYARFTHT